MVTQLMGVSVKTTMCSEIPGIPETFKALNGHNWVPLFICVVPTIDGGVCYGDEGGAASQTQMGFRAIVFGFRL